MTLVATACGGKKTETKKAPCEIVEARFRTLFQSGDTPNQKYLAKCRARPPSAAQLECYVQTEDVNLIRNCEHAVPKAQRKTGGDCTKIAARMHKLAKRDSPHVVANGAKRELKRMAFFCRIQGATRSQETCVSRAATLQAATACE